MGVDRARLLSFARVFERMHPVQSPMQRVAAPCSAMRPHCRPTRPPTSCEIASATDLVFTASCWGNTSALRPHKLAPCAPNAAPQPTHLVRNRLGDRLGDIPQLLGKNQGWVVCSVPPAAGVGQAAEAIAYDVETRAADRDAHAAAAERRAVVCAGANGCVKGGGERAGQQHAGGRMHKCIAQAQSSDGTHRSQPPSAPSVVTSASHTAKSSATARHMDMMSRSSATLKPSFESVE